MGELTTRSLRMVPTLCCLCQIEDAEPIAVGEDFEYRTSDESFLMVRCRRCGLLYLNPRPAEEEFTTIYPKTYHAFQFVPEEFGMSYKVRCWLESRRLRSWCYDLPEDAKILDVGCGDGFHLKLLRALGPKTWTLEGIDADERAVRMANQAGLQVQLGTLESWKSKDNQYHLILLIMTIEHVADPKQLLDQIYKLLKPNGKVVIVTDNAGSLDQRLFAGRHWGGYHFPRHWNLFTKRTLQELASRCGLVVERSRTAMSPVNWVYSFHNLLTDWQYPTWLIRRFRLQSFVSMASFTLLDGFLNLFGKGSILQVILRKPSLSSVTELVS